jgi:hypothetical protein
MLTAGSCKKETDALSVPAVNVTVNSVSYPPTEADNYIQSTATVQLRKRDGRYSQEKTVTGTEPAVLSAWSPATIGSTRP